MGHKPQWAPFEKFPWSIGSAGYSVNSNFPHFGTLMQAGSATYQDTKTLRADRAKGGGSPGGDIRRERDIAEVPAKALSFEQAPPK